MDLQLEGRVALVLGASGGLGGAIARSLGREGAKVACAGRNLEAAEQTAQEIRNVGGQAEAFAWDLADHAAGEERLAEIVARMGPIDILVNNTGGPPPTKAAGVDAAVWSKSFESMVASVIRLTDLVLPGMRERGWGRIITSTSSGMVAPIPNLAISNSLRMALLGWSKTLSSEVAADGVTVNVVLPGRIATKRIAALDEAKAKREGRDVASVEAENLRTIPMGRIGDPEEYGDVVAFLASGLASYVTGSVIRVDGGYIPSV